MSIRRRLPQSDEQRVRAINSAKNKMDNPGPDGNFLTTPTQTRLDDIYTNFNEAKNEAALALGNQAESTEDVVPKKLNAAKFVSHFIQVFNLGVSRGRYPKAHRAYYQLDINSEAVPPLTSEADITLWGQHIAEGDALRTGVGGDDMENPTAVEVAAAVLLFTNANTGQSTLKDTYDDMLEAIDALRPEADGVIKKVWDEVETFYNEEEAASKRRNAREWGVIYVSDIPLTFHITVTDGNTSLPLEGVLVEMLETGNDVTTNSAGQADLVSNISAEVCTLQFTKAGYGTHMEQVTLTEDTEYNVGVALT